MKTLIWKELRENGKWAALGMVVLGLAEFYGLKYVADNSRIVVNTTFFYGNTDVGGTLCKPTFLSATAMGCAAIGFLLALIQILSEQKRDQWAALLHRPLHRETILLSKALAGLLLYFCSTLPPFLACAWYAFTPGHFAAPVVPGMMVPGMMDIAAGTMFYAGGLFVALRRGAWYGPRLAGVAGAIVIRFVIVQQSVAGALLLNAIMFCLLMLAARGAIQTNGPLARMGLAGKIATILVTLLMFSVLVPLCLAFSVMWGDWLTGYKLTFNGPEYGIDQTGKPFVVIESPYSAKDLAGNVIKTPPEPLFSESVWLNDNAQVSQSFYSNTDYIDECYDRQGERWYFVKNEKRYVGYSLTDNLCIGSVGLEGFKHAPEEAKPFEEPAITWGQNKNIVQSGRSFYLAHLLNNRRTTLFYTSPEETEVYGVLELNPVRQNDTDFWLAIVLKDHLELVDMGGAKTSLPPISLSYSHEQKIWESIGISPTADSCFVIQYIPNDWNERKDTGQPSYLEKWDAHGKLIETTVLPHLKGQSSSGRVLSLAGSMLFIVDLDTFGISEVLGYLSYAQIETLLGAKETAAQVNSRRDGPLYYFLPQILIVSIVFAGITFYLARRMEFSQQRASAWTLLVLATNLPGYLTFRLLSDWPQRVPCPTCQKRRAVAEQICPHCKTAWPLPKRDGTEIFEPAEEQPTVLRS